jgi:hypothetical protein
LPDEDVMRPIDHDFVDRWVIEDRAQRRQRIQKAGEAPLGKPSGIPDAVGGAEAMDQI